MTEQCEHCEQDLEPNPSRKICDRCWYELQDLYDKLDDIDENIAEKSLEIDNFDRLGIAVDDGKNAVNAEIDRVEEVEVE